MVTQNCHLARDTRTGWLRKRESNFLKCNFLVGYVHLMMVESVCATTRKLYVPRWIIIVISHCTNTHFRNACASHICDFVTASFLLATQYRILGATLGHRRTMSDIVNLVELHWTMTINDEYRKNFVVAGRLMLIRETWAQTKNTDARATLLSILWACYLHTFICRCDAKNDLCEAISFWM